MNEGRPNPTERQLSKSPNNEQAETTDIDKQRVLQAQERYKEDLEQRLGAYKDTPFEVYNDAIALETEIDFYRAEFKGRPKYWSFLKDCDYCCQMAFMHEADTIVFFDKSARGFGMLTHKILPIIALEKAINEGLNPNEIKIPKIEFFNPPSHRFDVNPEIMTPENLEDLRTRIQNGERILFFDESSQSERGKIYGLYENGIDQHRWDRAQIQNARVPKQQWVGPGGSTMRNFVRTLTSGMQPEDESRCLGFIGSSERTGGQDFAAIKKSVPGYPPSDFYNITESSPKDPFHVSSAHVYGEDITLQRKRVRDEHSRMAWELFREVILKENLAQSTEEAKEAKRQELSEDLAEWGITAKLHEAGRLADDIIQSFIADGSILDEEKLSWPGGEVGVLYVQTSNARDFSRSLGEFWRHASVEAIVRQGLWSFQNALDNGPKFFACTIDEKREEKVKKIIQIYQDVLLILNEHRDG